MADQPYTGTYPDELRDLMVGLRELADAEPGYLRAHDYMTGEVPEYFASARLRNRVQATGTNFRANLAKKAVTSITNRLEIANVSVPDNDALTKILQDQVWTANELNLEAPEWHERIGEYGDAYAIVWPGDDPGTVDIHFSSPVHTRAIYDPENPRRISYTIKWWTQGVGERKIQRVNLYYAGTGPTADGGRIEKWATREGTNGSEAEHWTEYEVPGEAWPLENPHGQIVHHFRTGRPYGRPLHADAYGPQDALNKLIVSLMSTVDFHLIPQRALLTEGSDGESDDDDFDDFVPDGVAPEDGSVPDPAQSGQSRLKTGPGELWIFENAKELVQLAAADPKNFLTPSDFFVRLMAAVTDFPLHMYDPGGDQPSGDSRRQSEGTMTMKIGRLQDGLEATWSGLLTKAMHILGYRDVKRVDIRWSPAAVVDDSEGWVTAKAKIEAGVPVAQVLQEMGYDATQVAGWLQNTDEQDLKRRVLLLGELAKATRDLGTGVGSGIIPPELVADIMASFLGTADDDAGQ